jgi:hypothetical protein
VTPDPHAPADPPPCAIADCGRASVRSLATGEVRKVFPDVPDARRTHLCREHYKEWKKATRKDRELQRLSW